MASAAHTGSARLDESKQPLAEEELRKMHAYWRAANYLSVGQIYLYANPLLHEPLKFEHIKPRLHGYPWLIHRLTYRRTNHDNFHVRGYKEEGTTTTPFDMTVLNDLDRFHLARDVVDSVPRLQRVGAHFKQFLRNKLVEHKQYMCEHGDDLPEIGDWKWPIRP
jgi:phosphoketolase